MAELRLDFSRPLSVKERRSFEARRCRLGGQFGTSAANATAVMKDRIGVPGRLSENGLRIRTAFSYLEKPVSLEDGSDRRAPGRELRPPATRISSSKGAALRLYLTALAVAQVKYSPGRRPRFDMPLVSFTGELGWSDLLATAAVASRRGPGATGSSIRDKKARSLHTALDTLEDAGLVDLLGAPGERGRYDRFELLEEAGLQRDADPIPYTVPGRSKDCFALPEGFVTNGWLHVLEDSEITLLLMVACGRGTLTAIGEDPEIRDDEVAIPGETRLGHYGIHRDPFSLARKTLEWFGLMDVREMYRNRDGRAEEAATRLHRLSLLKEGFEADALDVVKESIDRQLDRV